MDPKTSRITRQMDRRAALSSALSRRLALRVGEIATRQSLAGSPLQSSEILSILEEILAVCSELGDVSLGATYSLDGQKLVVQRSVGFTPLLARDLPDFFGRPELLLGCLANGSPIRIPSPAISGAKAEEILSRAGAKSLSIISFAAEGGPKAVLVMGSVIRDLDEEWNDINQLVGSYIGSVMASPATVLARMSLLEERYRLLAEASSDVISRHSPDGVYLYVSPSSKAVLGLGPGDLLGQRVTDRVSPDDRLLVAQALKVLSRNGEARTFTYRFARGDGNLVWLETTGRPLVDPQTGQLLGIQASTRDISDRKRVELELRRSEERFTRLFRGSPVAMAVTTWPEGRFVEVNDAFVLLSGFAAADLVGKTWREQDLWAASDPDAALRDILETAGAGHEGPFILRDAMGELRECAMTIQTMDLGGQPCVSLFLRDETERLRTQRAAAELVALKAQFMATASHELRTPLAIVKGYADLLGNPAFDLTKEEEGVYLKRIRESCAHLCRIVSSLLDLAKGDHAPEPPTLVSVDLRDVAVRVAAMLSDRYPGRTARLAHPGILVAADSDLLEQVFLNLLDNAFKYPEGVAPPEIAWRTCKGSRVRVEVANDGPPLTEGEIGRLFQRFARLQRHTTLPGTGLGLAACRSHVERMGGEVGVGNAAGRIVFWFDLPSAAG